MWLPIRIDEQRPEPLYHQITTQLRRLILGGQLQAGTTLPSIRELAMSLKCSAITVRRVYQDLENEGLIRTRQGMGTFVANIGDTVKSAQVLAHVADQLGQAIEDGLQQQCTLDELETLFAELIQIKRKEKG